MFVLDADPSFNAIKRIVMYFIHPIDGIDGVHFEYSNINLYFESLPLASSLWQTLDSYDVMLIIVKDLGNLFKTRKTRYFFFPATLFFK